MWQLGEMGLTARFWEVLRRAGRRGEGAIHETPSAMFADEIHETPSVLAASGE